MKVAVAGAGAAGRLGHPRTRGKRTHITLIERNPDHLDAAAIPEAHCRLAMPAN